jgi:hypothetical protein
VPTLLPKNGKSMTRATTTDTAIQAYSRRDRRGREALGVTGPVRDRFVRLLFLRSGLVDRWLGCMNILFVERARTIWGLHPRDMGLLRAGWS